MASIKNNAAPASTNAAVTGTSGGDTISGGAGADKINGNNSADYISGGAGDDRIHGNNGNDTLLGGAGSDDVKGGGGSDLLVYNYADGRTASDLYDGGDQQDSLRLEMTRADWLQSNVQADLAGLLSMFATSPADDGAAFNFASSGLKIDNIEKLEVIVDGQVMNAADEAVTAQADSATVGENGSVTINVLGNDQVPDLVKSVALTAPVGAGTLTQNADNSFSFSTGAAFDHLAAGQQQNVSFSYSVTDADGDVSEAVATIAVQGANDAASIAVDPSVTADNSVVEAGIAGGAPVGDATAGGKLLVTDVDTGQAAFQAPASTSGTYGNFSLDTATGLWTYALRNADANVQALTAGEGVTDALTVKSIDGTATYQLVVSITGTNDAPAITGAVTATVAEDGAASTLGALANASDVDAGTSLSVVDVAALPAGVSYDADAKTFTLDPTHSAFQSLAANQSATVSVNYAVSDGTVSTPASVQWTVTGTNDAPVVTGAVTTTVAEDGGASTLGALANASDVDAGTSLSVVDVAGLPAGVSYDADAKTFTLDPTHSAFQSLAANQSATVSVNYAVSDGTASTAAVAQWTVTGANDAPTFGGFATGSVTEDTATSVSRTLTINDPDAGQSAFNAANGLAGNYGTLNISSSGNWAYFLNNSLPAVQSLNTGQTLADTVNVTSIDGSVRPITITINGVNDVTQSLANTYSLGTAPGNSIGTAYNLNAANLVYTKSNDPEIDRVNAATSPSITVQATSSAGQWDYYKFTIAQNGTTVAFDYDGHSTAHDSWFNLLSSTGSVIFSADDAGSDNGTLTGLDSFLTTTLNAGTYYLGVGSYPNQPFAVSTTYEIQVSFIKPGGDPLVLDLNGDGAHFQAVDPSFAFDLNADGNADQLDWVSNQDALLVVDLDHSGTIEDGSEVLSEHFDGFGFGNSIEALRSLDGNVDGVVDAQDDAFASLLAWRDINSDGVSQDGELFTLSQLGIASISTRETLGSDSVDGQLVYAVGSFTYVGGATGSYAGVELGFTVANLDVEPAVSLLKTESL